MVKHYNLSYLDVSSPDGIIYTTDENAGKKMAAGLMEITPVHWWVDFDLKHIDVLYHSGGTVSSILKHRFNIEKENATGPEYVTKDGKEYCISDFRYYLKTASQDQVDITSYIYGHARGKLFHLPYRWSRCLILWKDDFFRIAHPEYMDKDRMMVLYLGIFAAGFQEDGVGSIDGYQIADYKTFVQVATDEQRRAVDAYIKSRRGHLSVWTRMHLMSIKGSIRQLFSRLYWSMKIDDLIFHLDEWFARHGINIQLADDEYYQS